MLAQTGEQLLRIACDIRELGARVQAGHDRQLASHTYNYRRALDRLLREAQAGIKRRGTRAREQVGSEGELLCERIRRRLENARRDTAHQAELITAHDFRRRGWLLASTADGAPARSAADLTAGSRIQLHLHDGHAQAVVEHATHNPGSRTP